MHVLSLDRDWWIAVDDPFSTVTLMTSSPSDLAGNSSIEIRSYRASISLPGWIGCERPGHRSHASHAYFRRPFRSVEAREPGVNSTEQIYFYCISTIFTLIPAHRGLHFAHKFTTAIAVSALRSSLPPQKVISSFSSTNETSKLQFFF